MHTMSDKRYMYAEDTVCYIHHMRSTRIDRNAHKSEFQLIKVYRLLSVLGVYTFVHTWKHVPTHVLQSLHWACAIVFVCVCECVRECVFGMLLLCNASLLLVNVLRFPVYPITIAHFCCRYCLHFRCCYFYS